MGRILCITNGLAGNCARVAHHEIGLVGSRKRDTAQGILRQIHRLLTESRFRSNLERLRSWYLAYAENRVAERVVDGLLERRSPEY